jgi:hypothetical protein
MTKKSDNSLMMKFPSDLETVALLQFSERAGLYRSETPNGAFLVEIEGDELRFIPYGGGETEKFRLVRA